MRPLVALALLLGLAGCGAAPGSPALVRVNGEGITQAQLDEECAFLGAAAPDRYDVLETLVDQALVLQEGRRAGAGLSKEQAEAALALALAGTDQKLLEDGLRARGLSLEAWRSRLRRSFDADEAVRLLVRRDLDVSRQEVQDRYWERITSYRSPERRILRQIFTKTRSAAESAMRELELGEAFSEVAQRRGQGPEAANGGLLGPMSQSQLPKALAKASQALKPGDYGPIVASHWGYHILYLEQKVPAESDSLDQAAPKARAELLRDKEQMVYQAWLARLRERAVIERLPGAPPAPHAAGPGKPKKKGKS